MSLILHVIVSSPALWARAEVTPPAFLVVMSPFGAWKILFSPFYLCPFLFEPRWLKLPTQTQGSGERLNHVPVGKAPGLGRWREGTGLLRTDLHAAVRQVLKTHLNTFHKGRVSILS